MYFPTMEFLQFCDNSQLRHTIRGFPSTHDKMNNDPNV